MYYSIVYVLVCAYTRWCTFFAVESIFEAVNNEAEKKDTKERRQRKMSSSKFVVCCVTTITEFNGYS